jgi:hypothetical protein
MRAPSAKQNSSNLHIVKNVSQSHYSDSEKPLFGKVDSGNVPPAQ